MKLFSTGSVSSSRQLHAWKDIMAEVYYSLEVKRHPADGLRGKIKEFDIGALSVTTFDSDEQRVLRTRSRIAADPDDSFVLVMPARERLFFAQNGRTGLVQPGGYVLISTSEFYELSCPDGFLNWTVKIPGQKLRDRVPNADDHCAGRFPYNPAMAHMAQSLIKNVQRNFSKTPPPDADSLANHLTDFVALMLRAEGGYHDTAERRSRYLLRRRVLNYIQVNLGDPNLSPTRIAEANGISMSYLYKIFGESGVTVCEAIRNLRLQRAYEFLAADSDGRTTVAEVAYAHGFRNVSHFSHAFRQKFDIAPRDVRRLSV